MSNFITDIIQNYLFLSYRRRFIDSDLQKYKQHIKGNILDIGGGRKRGLFKIPETKNLKWIIADADKNKKPDIVADAQALPFKKNTFDTVKATELFEHIKNPEKGISECLRVLKPGGFFIFSMPFLNPIHADPFDYQRYTEYKLKEILKNLGNNKIIILKKQGLAFSVIADIVKGWVKNWPLILRYSGYTIIYPLLELMVYAEKIKSVRKSLYLTKFTTGYFSVVKKSV